MGVFHRKKESEKAVDDREQIDANARAVEVLIVLADKNAALVAQLRALQEQLKYLTPSADSAVTKYDQKIKHLIEDLKIVLTRADNGQTPPKAIDGIMQIKVAILERNAKR